MDIAVDPLEGTNLCATGAPNAIAVLAASERGGLLHAPDLYMEKLVVGPSSKHAVHLDASVADNLNAIAKCLGRDVEDLVVVVLDRPRHEKLIADIRATGARIRLIGDGDLSAGISAAVAGSGVHAVMGTGGAPEGVLTAAAMRCLNGEIFARLVVEQAGTRGTVPRDGHHGLQAHLPLQGSGARRADRLRRHGRDRRHADARRPLLRRRHPHQLGHHAEHPHQIRFIDSIHISNQERRQGLLLASIERCGVIAIDAPPAGRCRRSQEAAAVIKAGGIVAMPTDTLYGLAADPFSPAAVERVFAAKGRPAERALPLVAADIAQVEEQLGALSPEARRLAAAYWPGPLTLLLPRPSTMPGKSPGGSRSGRPRARPCGGPRPVPCVRPAADGNECEPQRRAGDRLIRTMSRGRWVRGSGCFSTRG